MKTYLSRHANGFWYILTKDGSRRLGQVSTKTKNRIKAQRFLETYKFGSPAVCPAFSQLQTIVGERLKGVLAEKTVNSYKYEVRDFVRDMGDMTLDELTQEVAHKWAQKLKERQAISTFNTSLRNMRAVMNRCKRWYPQYAEYCAVFDSIELLREVQEERAFLTREQFNTLLQAEDSEFWRRVFTVMFYTGMRKAEMINLKWSSVDFQKNVVGILNSDEFSTKSGRNRYIPMTSRVKRILQEMHKNKSKKDVYVFSQKGGEKKLAAGNCSYAFERTLAKTGLDKRLTLHSLRHSFAGFCLMNGVDIFSRESFRQS